MLTESQAWELIASAKLLKKELLRNKQLFLVIGVRETYSFGLCNILHELYRQELITLETKNLMDQRIHQETLRIHGAYKTFCWSLDDEGHQQLLAFAHKCAENCE